MYCAHTKEDVKETIFIISIVIKTAAIQSVLNFTESDKHLLLPGNTIPFYLFIFTFALLNSLRG